MENSLLVLINSVLDALPTNMMAVFPMPGGVEKKIDKLRRFPLERKQREQKWKSGEMASSDS